jgi:hypothetical protein
MHLLPGQSEGECLTLRLKGGQILLLHQTLAEAAFGIRLPNFATQVGMARTKARAFIDAIEALMKKQPHDADQLPIGTFDLDFSATDVRALRNALELVMTDFGHDEFSTRTGFDLSDGAQLLDELNAVLLGPLHIGQRRETANHEPQAVNTR